MRLPLLVHPARQLVHLSVQPFHVSSHTHGTICSGMMDMTGMLAAGFQDSAENHLPFTSGMIQRPAREDCSCCMASADWYLKCELGAPEYSERPARQVCILYQSHVLCATEGDANVITKSFECLQYGSAVTS